ncbi:MAG: DUF116 domain-containing protein [Thermoplasmatota archaeon]
MSYAFNFDLSNISQIIFREITELTESVKMKDKINNSAQKLVRKFDVDKLTGLPKGDSVTVIKDLIKSDLQNKENKEKFEKSTNRLLLLPHCCRKYMDSQCKARFDQQTASYICINCTKTCQVNKATKLAKKKNYDVFVIPGSSCVKRIFQKKAYDGVIGVACTEEIGLAIKMCNKLNIAVQNIPLIKNGCCETRFDFDTLKRIINDRKNN